MIVTFKGTSFFDRPAVTRAVDRAAREVLSKFGAFTRQRAKSSLRYRDKSGAPGQPPSVHRTQKHGGRMASPLKELIYFDYDPTEKNVVIGPAAFGTSGGVIPGVLERGGTAPGRHNNRRRLRKLGSGGEIRIGGHIGAMSKKNKDGKMVTYGKLKTAGQVDRANRLNEKLYGPKELPTHTIQAHPYMQPAFEVEKKGLPAMWAGAVK